MRVKRYFAPHLISTNYFADKAAPVILKHSESADLHRMESAGRHARLLRVQCSGGIQETNRNL